MPNHPITPLASSQINHDQVKVELVEPEAMPAMVRIVWPPQRLLSIRSVSLMLRPRSRSCSHGRISCSPRFTRTAGEPERSQPHLYLRNLPRRPYQGAVKGLALR